jgi:predicted amidohydrolase YtcJ
MGKEQRVTRVEAIRMYTINGAHLTFEEDLKGSIEPGKLADMVIIDRDILTCPEDEIKDTKVLRTFLGGKTVYKA